MSLRLAVVNGPNLGQLGEREPELYGHGTHRQLEDRCRQWGLVHGHAVQVQQADGEGVLVGILHEISCHCEGLVLNAGAYTHTSVAVRDAVASLTIPVVELHITNPDAREPLRRRNLLADVVTAGIRGFGLNGYILALTGLAVLLEGTD
jgi:3-dehydroquinate dehydratase-2